MTWYKQDDKLKENAKSAIKDAMSAIADIILKLDNLDRGVVGYLLGYLGCCALAQILADRFDFYVEHYIPEEYEKRLDEERKKVFEETKRENEALLLKQELEKLRKKLKEYKENE